MTSINKALDELIGHCARLADRLALDGYIDDATYADLTRVICDMGRCWTNNDIEGFKIFHSLYLAHYNLILWLTVLPNRPGHKQTPAGALNPAANLKEA
jgi:hypothetical protein